MEKNAAATLTHLSPFDLKTRAPYWLDAIFHIPNGCQFFSMNNSFLVHTNIAKQSALDLTQKLKLIAWLDLIVRLIRHKLLTNY